MNFFEKFVLAMLAAAEAEVPLFVHSAQGVVVLNASENIVNGLVASLATPAPAPISAPIAVVTAPAVEVTP